MRRDTIYIVMCVSVCALYTLYGFLVEITPAFQTKKKKTSNQTVI